MLLHSAKRELASGARGLSGGAGFKPSAGLARWVSCTRTASASADITLRALIITELFTQTGTHPTTYLRCVHPTTSCTCALRYMYITSGSL